MIEIDLRSDTVTRPSPDMRAAMASAAVGDDVFGDDPTVQALEAMAAQLTGKAAALYLPSGTMANQIAVMLHTRRGEAVLCGAGAHTHLHETGGAAAIAGVMMLTVGRDGLFTADELERALTPDDVHFPRSSLVCLENTHNGSGGRVFPFAEQARIVEVARARGLRLHLDGARLFNAMVASGLDVRTLSAPFDTVFFALSKGLGAPVGSLLCGSEALMREARRLRKMLGGGMRQAGILAAAGLYALEHNVARLAVDHANARRLGEGLRRLGVELVAEPETNMVLFRVPGDRTLSTRAREKGLGLGSPRPETYRAVTHLDVDEAAIDRALHIFEELLATAPGR